MSQHKANFLRSTCTNFAVDMYNKKIPIDISCGFRIAIKVMGGKWNPISSTNCWTVRSVRVNCSAECPRPVSACCPKEILKEKEGRQMRTFLERLAFPWLSYNDYRLTAPKRMPVVLMETMNGLPDRNNSNGYG
ncbi:MAG: hypothetical protein IJ190_09515 [Prevotella sp.]|nr:hypothetical protein [Prevotella sp.]